VGRLQKSVGETCWCFCAPFQLLGHYNIIITKPKPISAATSLRQHSASMTRHAAPSLPRACTSANTGHGTQLAIYEGVSQTGHGQDSKHYSIAQSSVGWLRSGLKLLRLALASMPADAWCNQKLPYPGRRLARAERQTQTKPHSTGAGCLVAKLVPEFHRRLGQASVRLHGEGYKARSNWAPLVRKRSSSAGRGRKLRLKLCQRRGRGFGRRGGGCQRCPCWRCHGKAP
jgi:hypothetical protein